LKRKIFLLANYLLAGGLLFYLFRKSGGSFSLDFLKGASPVYLVPASLTALFFRMLFYPWLWQKSFVSSGCAVAFRELFLVNAASLPLKYLLPFKITEIVRSAGIRLLGQVDFLCALSTTVLLRIVAILSTLFLFFLGGLGRGDIRAVLISGLIMLFLILLTVFFGKLPDEVFGIDISKAKIPFVSSGYAEKQVLFLYALVMQSGEVLTSFFIIKAAGLHFSFPVLLYSVSLMMLFSMLPFSVQGIGVRETVSVLTFGRLVSSGEALRIGLLLTLIHHVFPAVLGGLIWLFNSTMRIFGKSSLSEV